MESVPETERMEAFKVPPIPTLRLSDIQTPPRRSSEPAYRPRNTSPLSRGHMRSRSTASPGPQTMSRTQSLPGFGGHEAFILPRSSSPLSITKRVPKKPVDDAFPGFPGRALREISETEAILNGDEVTGASERSRSPVLGTASSNYIRSRRPASPLRYTAQQNAVAAMSGPPTPPPSASSPLYPNPRFGDSFLSTTSYPISNYPSSFSSSSVPSTPTSLRSRSPSISSLETIPDSPDAEEAALEAERIAQLKAAADAADAKRDGLTGMLELSGRGRTLGLSSRDKRKRWSVCGAERRGDLNLDTIWED